MDEASIKFGGRVLNLKKSEKLIAVKPRPGVERKVLSEIAPQLSSPDLAKPSLGGFQLINVEHMDTPMEETLNTMRENAAINTGTHVFHTSDDEVPFVPTGQLYIECGEEVSPEECQELIDKYHLQIVEARGEREFIVQVTADSMNPIKTAAALQESPLIKTAEPDLATPGKIQGFIVPSDPRLIDQWHLRNTGKHHGTSVGFLAGADARVIEAWELGQTLGSPNVVVAVIDDGFDLSHPDLTGDWKIVAPKDFTRNSASPIPDLLNEDWHGTACAGVAIGNADGTGIAGAAPRCRLMPIRWGRDLADREIENWFAYAREQGAWVVSCSWSAEARFFPLSTRAGRAIQRCAQEGRDGLGTVICFAAGNENRDINDPASNSVNGFAIHPDVIAVAASNSRDKKSNYSNFGEAISVCAPSSGAGGWGVTTSDVMGQYTRGNQTFEAGYSMGAYTDDFGGTSSACPLVAGICALVLSAKPELKAQEVKEIIEGSARRIDADGGSYDERGHSVYFGYGCVDAAAALRALEKQNEAKKSWGEEGHRTTNTIAIEALPPGDLKTFYELNQNYIDEHAMDADKAKPRNPEEGPRHFIDIDLYGDYPFQELPEDYDEAVKKFGQETVVARGTLPWQIEVTYDLLVEAFKQAREKDVLKHSAWLGHYVGDAHVPLHTTANHNGQLTGQKGLHGYFETRLLEKYVSPDEIKPAVGQQITRRPHLLAFEWVRESSTYVQPILEADAANGGKNGQRDIRSFAQVAKPIAIQRLTKGCTRLASLWFSAWVEAGKPKLN